MKAVEIKIASVMAIAATLGSVNLTVVAASLQQLTNGMSDFFDNEFTVLDVGGLELAAGVCDWPALVALFRKNQLLVVAVRHADASLHDEIIAAGLAIDHAVAPTLQEQPLPEPVVQQQELPWQAAEPAQQAVSAQTASTLVRNTMYIDTPVRAGQQIYAKNSDLVITAMVNNGAEIIADGSIHVYAPMRGRALAGASGDASARIFAASMEPELVSIAGIYRTFDDGFPAALIGKSVQCRLEGDKLDIRAVI